MNELTFELENYVDENGAFGATLVVDCYRLSEIQTCPLTDMPFTVSTIEISDATLFTYDRDGGSLAELRDIDPFEYVSLDDISEELEKN